MALSIREKADTVATWRHISVHLLETLARWVPTAPELEAKALFGRHIWELAQFADACGHRTAELRAALHETRPPRHDYTEALAAARAVVATGDRVACFYDAALPDFARRLETYRAAADELLDEPTVRILERARLDFNRMDEQAAALLQERPDLRPHDAGLVRRVRGAFAAVPDMVEYRPAELAGAAS